MLTVVLPHVTDPGAAQTPAYGEAFVLVAVVAVGALYARGRRRAARGSRRRGADVAFGAGCLATIAALASPLDALSGELASAHMVQHVSLMLVAAPLFAWSAPVSVIARGVPPHMLARVARPARAIGRARRRLERFATPAVVTATYVALVWAWHVPVLYDAAVGSRWIHAVEHGSFLGSAVLFWAIIAFPRRAAIAPGTRILVLFGVAMQSVFLAVLLTFARTPWYESYISTTARWRLLPLEDQQLAGAIMWVPAGIVYVAIALGIASAWLASIDATSSPAAPRSTRPAWVGADGQQGSGRIFTGAAARARALASCPGLVPRRFPLIVRGYRPGRAWRRSCNRHDA